MSSSLLPDPVVPEITACGPCATRSITTVPSTSRPIGATREPATAGASGSRSASDTCDGSCSRAGRSPRASARARSSWAAADASCAVRASGSRSRAPSVPAPEMPPSAPAEIRMPQPWTRSASSPVHEMTIGSSSPSRTLYRPGLPVITACGRCSAHASSGGTVSTASTGERRAATLIATARATAAPTTGGPTMPIPSRASATSGASRTSDAANRTRSRADTTSSGASSGSSPLSCTRPTSAPHPRRTGTGPPRASPHPASAVSRSSRSRSRPCASAIVSAARSSAARYRTRSRLAARRLPTLPSTRPPTATTGPSTANSRL